MTVDPDELGADGEFVRALLRYHIDLALFGVADARRHLIEADPQAKHALGLFADARALTPTLREQPSGCSLAAGPSIGAAHANARPGSCEEPPKNGLPAGPPGDALRSDPSHHILWANFTLPQGLGPWYTATVHEAIREASLGALSEPAECAAGPAGASRDGRVLPSSRPPPRGRCSVRKIALGAPSRSIVDVS